MDFHLRIAIFYLAGVALSTVDAGCVEDLAQDSEFTDCQAAFMQFFQNAQGELGENPDLSTITKVFCSDEAKSSMTCILNKVKGCDGLSQDPNFAGVASVMTMIDQFGGYDNLCDNTGALSKCQAAAQCISEVKFTPETPTSQPKTPFSMYQMQIGMICGPIQAQMACVKDAMKECEALMMQIQQGFNNSQSGIPEFKVVKSFAMEKCPRMPDDFSANQCVKNKLESAEFQECFQNSTTKYAVQGSDKISCDAYKSAFSCIPEAVTEECGAQYTSAFRHTTNFFLSASHQNCQLPEETSGSKIVTVSSAALITSLIFLML